MWTVRSTWLFTLIATSVLVGLGTLLGFESAADPADIQGEPAWTTASFIAMPAQFAFLGLALVTVTSDYATGGIVTTLQWTPRRGTLFAARTLVTVLVATGIGVALTTASALAAKTTARDALTLHAADGLDMLGKVGFVFTAGTVLAVGLGFLLRNTAGGIIALVLTTWRTRRPPTRRSSPPTTRRQPPTHRQPTKTEGPEAVLRGLQSMMR